MDMGNLMKEKRNDIFGLSAFIGRENFVTSVKVSDMRLGRKTILIF